MVAEAPDGRTFLVAVVPPGSAMDTDDTNPYGLLGWVLSAIRGGVSREWRVTVTERRPDGRLGRTLLRDRFDGEAGAQERAHELWGLISSGGWPPSR